MAILSTNEKYCQRLYISPKQYSDAYEFLFTNATTSSYFWVYCLKTTAHDTIYCTVSGVRWESQHIRSHAQQNHLQQESGYTRIISNDLYKDK